MTDFQNERNPRVKLHPPLSPFESVHTISPAAFLAPETPSMNISLRSSQSSYGDPRYLSTATISDAHAPLGKSLVDGYRDAVDPQHEGSRYNPVGEPLIHCNLRTAESRKNHVAKENKLTQNTSIYTA